MFDWLFGGGDEEEFTYQFQEDPYVGQTQDKLFPFYSGLLEGNIPSYYKPLGEYGGKEFNDLLNLTLADTQKGVGENLVRRGISRSGVGAAAMAPTIAKTSASMRYNDFLRAMEGRGNLLNVGTRGLEGVRQAGLSNQAMKNQYGFDVAKTNYDTGLAEDEMWSNILSSGIGAAGNIYGMNMLKDVMGTGTGGTGKIDSGKNLGKAGDSMEWIKLGAELLPLLI